VVTTRSSRARGGRVDESWGLSPIFVERCKRRSTHHGDDFAFPDKRTVILTNSFTFCDDSRSLHA